MSVEKYRFTFTNIQSFDMIEISADNFDSDTSAVQFGKDLRDVIETNLVTFGPVQITIFKQFIDDISPISN